jgi:hypothetical protein
MFTKASTGKARKECLSRYCEKLDMKAQYVYETEVLSFLFNTMIHGGNVLIINRKGETCHWFLPGWTKSQDGETVNATDLKSVEETPEGSTPSLGTNKKNSK